MYFTASEHLPMSASELEVLSVEVERDFALRFLRAQSSHLIHDAFGAAAQHRHASLVDRVGVAKQQRRRLGIM